MRAVRRWIAVGLLLLLALTAVWVTVGTARRERPQKAGPPASGGSSTPVHANIREIRPATPRITIWARGSWCWFGDPRAVHIGERGGETFVGWIDWRGNITIGMDDPHGRRLRTHVVGRLPIDDHGSPAILIEPSRRLTVFWAGHGGPTMNYRTTRHPLDISSWGPIGHVRSMLHGPLGFTYANPVLLRGERDTLYLLWRGADWSQDYAMRTRGGRWSPARRLIDVPGQRRERPYVKVDSDGSDTIALGFTDGHPRSAVTSVYYAAYRRGWLWRANGRRIAPLRKAPISPRQADLIYNGHATGVSSWVWDVAVGRRNRPVVVYATFPSPQRHLYWYASWNGARWISHLMTVGGPSISPGTIEYEYSGGLALDHNDPSVVYLSRKVGPWFEIERWTTPDGGYHWTYRTVVRTPGADDVRPIVPRGPAGGRVSLLWLHGPYRGYKRYRTTIAFAR